jgi:hypothetical protein
LLLMILDRVEIRTVALDAQCRAAGFGSARGGAAASPPGIGINAVA